MPQERAVGRVEAVDLGGHQVFDRVGQRLVERGRPGHGAELPQEQRIAARTLRQRGELVRRQRPSPGRGLEEARGVRGVERFQASATGRPHLRGP